MPQTFAPRSRLARSVAVALAVTLVAALALLARGGAPPAQAAAAPEPTYCYPTQSRVLSNMNITPAAKPVVGLPAQYTPEGIRPVMESRSTSAEDQRWCEFAVGANGVEYRNRISGKCLTVAGNSNGSFVIQTSCESTLNQRWDRWYLNNGRILLQNLASGRCLSVTDSNPAPGAKLVIWNCTDAWQQAWAFGDYNS